MVRIYHKNKAAHQTSTVLLVLLSAWFILSSNKHRAACLALCLVYLTANCLTTSRAGGLDLRTLLVHKSRRSAMQQRGGLIDTQTHREKGIPKGALNTHKMHAETGVFNTHRKGVLTQKGSLHTDARGLMRTFTTRGPDDRTKGPSPDNLSVRCLLPGSTPLWPAHAACFSLCDHPDVVIIVVDRQQLFIGKEACDFWSGKLDFLQS